MHSTASSKFQEMVSLLFFLLVTGIITSGANAQDAPFLSPYAADSNTVVLFHFNESVSNSSVLSVDDATPHGDISYLPASDLDLSSDFGQVLRLNNNARSDSSYLSVPDTSALDLTGSWTIEFWANIITFGETRDDWRERPKIVTKPGPSTDRGAVNYQTLIDGSLRNFSANYYTHSDGGDWINIETVDNIFTIGTWFHATYVRDSTNQLQVLMVHNKSGEMVGFAASPFDAVNESPPNRSDADLTIGMMKDRSSSWTDGFIDELRISNIVRDFDAPPVLSELTDINNLDSSQTLEVSVSANNMEGNQIDQVLLRYKTDNDWQHIAMTSDSGQTFSGTLPAISEGTAVEYYVEATNQNGLSAAIPEGASQTSGPYKNFAVIGDREVFHLDFEDAELPPSRNTMLTEWTMEGNPQIADQGANGTTQSLYLEGDSSYMRGHNPQAAFMKSDEFVVDTWFKAESELPGVGTRIMIKESVPPEDNYFLFSLHRGRSGGLRLASYFPGSSFNRSGNLMNLGLIDTSISPGHWYRYVGVVNSSDTLYYRFYDAENDLIGEHGSSLQEGDEVHPANGPFMLGVKQNALPTGPFFQGYIDEVKYYNYIPEKYSGSEVSVEEPRALPRKITLGKNYPNPFNPTTKITYRLPTSMEIELSVYNALGQKIQTLVDRREKAGAHTATFRAGNISSGVYLFRLKTPETTKTQKMLLLK